MLKKVQVAPLLFTDVMHRTTFGTAFLAAETAPARKINLDIQLLGSSVKRRPGNPPGGGEAKGQLKKINVTHPKLIAPANQMR